MNHVSRIHVSLFVLVMSSVVALPAIASEPQEVRLVIRNHRFVPSETVVPANTKLKLIVVNEDPTPEEFESHELNREKIVLGGGTIPVYISPLKPGRYPFFGDFHADIAQGALLAK
jgi:hypothetical protein